MDARAPSQAEVDISNKFELFNILDVDLGGCYLKVHLPTAHAQQPARAARQSHVWGPR